MGVQSKPSRPRRFQLEMGFHSQRTLPLVPLTLTRLASLPQFEYVSQHLVFANCIPLILKFFNQNIMSYITAKNRYSHCWGRERGGGAGRNVHEAPKHAVGLSER